jgi:hypothetical protein
MLATFTHHKKRVKGCSLFPDDDIFFYLLLNLRYLAFISTLQFRNRVLNMQISHKSTTLHKFLVFFLFISILHFHLLHSFTVSNYEMIKHKKLTLCERKCDFKYNLLKFIYQRNVKWERKILERAHSTAVSRICLLAIIVALFVYNFCCTDIVG